MSRTYSVDPLEILVLTFLLSAAQAANWNCNDHAIARTVNIEKMSGIWYEVARAPSSDVPACLKVIAPNEVNDGNYTIHLDYMNNVSKKWKHTEEDLTFPWEYAEKGIFNTSFSGGSIKLNVNFKYLGTFRNVSLVCGYSGLVPGISILRLLSRNATVDHKILGQVSEILNYANVSADVSEITWVEQGAKCSGSAITSSVCIMLLVFFIMSLLKIHN